MFSLSSSHRYHLYRGVCNMRKSFNGMSRLVRSELGRDPAGGEEFVFLNRRRTLMKLLHWEAGLYVPYYKRLEQCSFVAPTLEVNQTVVRWPELVLMVEGITSECSPKGRRYQR